MTEALAVLPETRATLGEREPREGATDLAKLLPEMVAPRGRRLPVGESRKRPLLDRSSAPFISVLGLGSHLPWFIVTRCRRSTNFVVGVWGVVMPWRVVLGLCGR